MFVGIIVGVVSFIDSVLSNISTNNSSGLYLKSISVICFLVTPSRTTKLGVWIYPLPKEVIPIDLNPVRGVILRTWGNISSGCKVESDG